jgi:hypothetical protein
MSYKEKDIMLEFGAYWVLKTKQAYTVLKAGLTHSKPDSSYALNPDGLSIAIARAKYLARVKP